MNKSFTENLNMNGHLTISKISNGEEEIIFDEKNVIVSGFGVGMAYLFSRQGSTNIIDYQIDRFQLGVSGNSGAQVSSTFQLSSSLTSIDQYTTTGLDSNLFAFTGTQIKNGANANSVFCKIPFTKVTRVDDRSVRYTIFIDEDSCNNLSSLNEIGLFMKNPRGDANDASILVAYRYFTNIQKTSDFGLMFRWTISFG
ncbi:MAG: hypothetical protein RL348_111 [Bacteroidota bacterium]